jgi:hypothetical protein
MWQVPWEVYQNRSFFPTRSRPDQVPKRARSKGELSLIVMILNILNAHPGLPRADPPGGEKERKKQLTRTSTRYTFMSAIHSRAACIRIPRARLWFPASSRAEAHPLVHRCVLKSAGNGNDGHMDSQGGHLDHRLGTMPFPGARKCVKIFELDTHVVRLRIEKENSGGVQLEWLPTGPLGARQVPSGQELQARREYHAF